MSFLLSPIGVNNASSKLCPPHLMHVETDISTLLLLAKHSPAFPSLRGAGRRETCCNYDMLRRNRQEASVRLNKGGLILCGVYTVIFIVMAAEAYFADDPKGVAFFGQLAVFPALASLSWLGLIELIPVDSRLNSVFFLFPLSLAITYLIGCVIGWPIGWILNRYGLLDD